MPSHDERTAIDDQLVKLHDDGVPMPVGPRRNEQSHGKQAFAGGVAAIVTRFVCQPFDVLKIRFQLQVEPMSCRKSKYVSMPQAVATIFRDEGIAGFWKGHMPGQLLSIVYGVAQFWAFEECKDQAKRLNLYYHNENLANFVCGSMAGALGTVTVTPIDVVRTRLIAQDMQRGYPNTYRAFLTIGRMEGIRGLYRGFFLSLFQVAPLTGINFMAYKFLCTNTVDVMHLHAKSEIPAIITLFNGAMAGLVSKAVVYPLDLAKKRMQIQGFGEHRKNFGKHFECAGISSCFRETIKREGYRGLYKGMWPSVLKTGVTSALNFCIYDNINLLIQTSK